MSWDLEKATGQEEQGSKTNFTKFPEGITQITVLGAEPHVRWTHWQPKFTRSINCPGRGCPICEIRKRQKTNGESYTHDMSRRFSIGIYNHDTAQYEIMEQGKTFMEDLRDVMESLSKKGKALNTVTLDVKRRGMGKDNTSYRIDVSEELKPVPSNVEEIDLLEYYKPHTVEQILALLNVPFGSKEEMLEAWIAITSPQQEEAKPAETPAQPELSDLPDEGSPVESNSESPFELA